MAGYIRSKGQVLISRSQIRKSHQWINPTDHERRRADTVRARNPIPYNAAYSGHKLHCDQNEKRSRYGCTLFAFNDGSISKIVRMFCMPIKKNATIVYSQFRFVVLNLLNFQHAPLEKAN